MSASTQSPAFVAYEAVAEALRCRPTLTAPIAEFPSLRLVTALIDLEKRFGIDLEVDEVLTVRTVGGLLDLVQTKAATAAARGHGQHVDVYDFTAICAAIGRPIRPQPAPEPQPLTIVELAEALAMPADFAATPCTSFSVDAEQFSVIAAPDYLAPPPVLNPQAQPKADDPQPAARSPFWLRALGFTLSMFLTGFVIEVVRTAHALLLGWPH